MDIAMLENEVYEWHLKVLSVEIELLDEEESLLKHKIAARKMDLTSK